MKSSSHSPESRPRSRYYRDRDLKLLFGLAGFRCSIPSCRERCFCAGTPAGDPDVVTGEIGHIIPFEKGWARHDESFPAEQLNRYPNLVLLCRRCHPVVDHQTSKFSAPQLHTMKKEHEEWVDERLSEGTAAASFAQLETIADAIASKAFSLEVDFSLTEIEEKINRNGLSEIVQQRLQYGLLKADQVRHFLEEMAKLHRQFPENLRAGFVGQYNRLAADGHSGDSLFLALHEFACLGRHDFLWQGAALAILTCLFESCDVFER